MSGMDRSVASHLTDGSTVFDLLNFRPSRAAGVFDQTPYFRESVQYARGTYWDGAAPATEPTTSAVKGYTPAGSVYAWTEYTVLASSTAMQVFYQVTQPAAENNNTGCLVLINNVAGLALALGSTLDIEIDAAATFRWRKNGGGWTAGVAITTTGVSIDGGNVTVYFLTATGFTVGHLWQWRRTDANFETLANVAFSNYTTQYCFLNDGTVYYTSQDNRVMAIRSAGGTRYAISAGYRAVYGRHVTIFENHLIVTGFSKTAVVATGATTLVVGWSDNITFENFIPTDTNEADQKTLDVRDPSDFITGVAVLQQQLFIFTIRAIHYSPYLGLPSVFAFKEFALVSSLNSYYPIIPAPGGVYICGAFRMFFFNGSTIEPIEYPLNPQTPVKTNSIGSVIGFFDPVTNEVFIVTSDSIMYVYQGLTKKWYRRSVDFNAVAFPSAIYSSNGDVILGSISRKVLGSEWGQTLVYQPVFDSASGTAYVTPKITYQSYAGVIKSLKQEKEIKGAFLAATVFSTLVSTAYYSTDANCQVKLHWYLSPVGLISGTPATDANAVWVNTNTDGRIDFPRSPFRAVALELQLVGLVANKPPYQATIYGLELDVRDPNEPELAR